MRVIKGILLVFMLPVFSVLSYAQKGTEPQIRQAVESKQYVFLAERLHPQSGMSRVLTQGYDLTISADKVVAYLPYYGRVYTPMLNSDGGIKFTSSDFEYSKTAVKDGWEISIRPKDVPLVSRMQMTVFDNGTANLYITSNNRESVSYSGKIKSTQGKRGF